MKRNFKTFVLGAACAGVSITTFGAGEPQTKFYIQADAGGEWTMDTDLKGFFGPVAPGSKVKFDPGVRFGVRGGYQINEWLAVEAESGAMANNISSVSAASKVDATFSNVPLLANVRLQLPKSKCPVTPYIGGGLGTSIAGIDANNITVGGTKMNGSEATAVFAYQGFAGVRYELNERMGISLEYHYFATTQPTWSADSTAGTTTDTLRFGGIETHAVSVAFDYKF
jgi:opacity protein-like surface antigen